MEQALGLVRNTTLVDYSNSDGVVATVAGDDISKTKKLIGFYFGASWCGP